MIYSTILQTCPYCGGGSGMWGMGPGMWGFGWMFLWLVVLGGLVLGAFYLLTRRGGSTEKPEDRAMELLREQYARGEISDEEFEERSSRLAGISGGRSGRNSSS